MTKRLLYIVIFICLAQTIHAQEDGVVAFSIPVRNSLKFNKYAINPTFSFVREQNKYLSFTNKREWVQFDNAPETYLFSFSGRLAENTGAGIGLFQQNYGVLSTFGGILNYAQNVVLDRDSNLTFGLNLAFYKSGINEANVITNFSDPSLENMPSNMIATISPGINYGTTFLDFGVSLNNLVAYNIKTSSIIEDNPEQSVQAHVMYTGYVESRGFFDNSKFSGLVWSEFKREQTVISGIMMLNIPKGLWGQAGYNTLYGLSAGIGLNITKQIAIEYNFEKEMGEMVEFGNSHEVTLAYKFSKRDRYNYSDDDEETALFAPSKSYKRSSGKRTTTTTAKVDRAAIAEKKAIARAEAIARIEAKKEERLKAIEEAKGNSAAENKVAESTSSEPVIKSEESVEQKLAEEAETKAAAEEAARLKLVEEAKAKAKAAADEAARLKLVEEAKAKAEALAKQKLADEAKAKAAAEETARLKLVEEAKAKSEALAKQKQADEAKAKAAAEEAARLKLVEEAKAKSEALAKQKQADEAKAKVAAEEATRLKLVEEAKAKSEALAKQKQADEAKAKAAAEEAARLKLVEEAKAKSEALAKQKQADEAKAKAEAEEAARLKLVEEAKAKSEALAKQKQADEAKAKAAAEEAARLKLVEEAKSKSEALAKQKQADEAKANAAAVEAKRKIEQEARIKQEELDAALILLPTDAIGMEMSSLTKLATDSKLVQEQLLIKLNETVANREKDLKDLKQENDLSEQGIYSEPKPFKSVSAENASLESLKVQIDDLIKAQDSKITELENLYKKRLKNIPDPEDNVNMIYLNEILILKQAQAKAKRSKESLVSELESIKIATEIERKRRIKRAAYDNEQDRYNKDRATLNQIKQSTEISNASLSVEDFDFGEEQSYNIQIIKDVRNIESGYYLVLAVHSDSSKRDDFLRKAVAAGQKNIDFFFDVATNKYYIYYQKFEDINEARNAMQSKGNTAYNAKMSMFKIEN